MKSKTSNLVQVQRRAIRLSLAQPGIVFNVIRKRGRGSWLRGKWMPGKHDPRWCIVLLACSDDIVNAGYCNGNMCPPNEFIGSEMDFLLMSG